MDGKSGYFRITMTKQNSVQSLTDLPTYRTINQYPNMAAWSPALRRSCRLISDSSPVVFIECSPYPPHLALPFLVPISPCAVSLLYEDDWGGVRVNLVPPRSQGPLTSRKTCAKRRAKHVNGRNIARNYLQNLQTWQI